MSETESTFVDVVVQATGDRTYIPREWLTNPVLSRGYELYVAPTPEEPEESTTPNVVPDPPAGDEGEKHEPPHAPAESAGKDDWIAWGVFCEVQSGKSNDEANEAVVDMTKQELIDQYGAL